MIAAQTPPASPLSLRFRARIVLLCVTLSCGFSVLQRPALAQLPQASPSAALQSFADGVVSLKASRFPDAERSFRKVVELEPQAIKGYLGVAQVYLAQQKPDEAIRYLRSEIERSPLRPDLHLALGDTAVRAGQNDLALTEFQNVLTMSGGQISPELYVPRGAEGATFVGSPRADAMTESINTLAGRDATPKGAAGVHIRLAEVHILQKNLAAAAGEWQKTAELMPTSSWVKTNLGMSLDGAGKQTEAIKAYREAIALGPSEVLALNNLAFLIAETGGDLYEALRFARRASALLPGSAEIMDTEGWIALKQGFLDDAVETFLRVVDRQPGKVSFRQHLSMALTKRGRHSKAGDALVLALDKPAGAGDADKIRGLIHELLTENRK